MVYFQDTPAQVAMTALLLIGFWNNQRLASAQRTDSEG
jgi:hypothetical protein